MRNTYYWGNLPFFFYIDLGIALFVLLPYLCSVELIIS